MGRGGVVVGLSVRTIADYAANGPLISVSVGDLPGLVGAPYGEVSQIINGSVKSAEASQPEGTAIQLEIDSVNDASAVIQQINRQFRAGKITNPSDGKPIVPWPEYPNQIAFPWNGGNGVMVRWIKTEWQIILVLVILLSIAAAIVYSLTRTPYRMQAVTSSSGSGSSSGPPFAGIHDGTLYLFWMPWYVDLPIAGVLVAAPFVLTQIGKGEEASAGVIRGTHDIEKAEAERGTGR